MIALFQVAGWAVGSALALGVVMVAMFALYALALALYGEALDLLEKTLEKK